MLQVLLFSLCLSPLHGVNDRQLHRFFYSLSLFSLLVYLAFVGITLLGVEHADFFISARKTYLPIVGIPIPTKAFFIFGPLIGTGLFIYLHWQLIQLWGTIASASLSTASIQSFRERLNPWVFSYFALSLTSDSPLKYSPLNIIMTVIVFFLVFLLHLIILIGFWWVSTAAHAEWLSFSIVCYFILSSYVSVISWNWLKHKLNNKLGLFSILSTQLKYVAGLFFSITLITISWLCTELDIMKTFKSKGQSSLTRASLLNVELTPRPQTWKDYQSSKATFLSQWCETYDISTSECRELKGHAPVKYNPSSAVAIKCDKIRSYSSSRSIVVRELDREYFTEWKSFRADINGVVQIQNLEHVDLRGSYLLNTFAAKVNFHAARFEGASFENVLLEGANLSKANLSSVKIYSSNLQGVNLSKAIINGKHSRILCSDLEDVNLSDSNLSYAVIQSSNMKYANFDRAKLIHTDMRMNNLEGASLYKTDLSGANLGQTKGLIQSQLNHAYGDKTTILPDYLAPDTGKHLYVWSCDNGEKVRLASKSCKEGEMPVKLFSGVEENKY